MTNQNNMTQNKALEVLKSGVNVFLTGEPGSGKSYTINQFRKWMDENGVPYAITASTGIAATHIGGTTIHSWSGIGIKEQIDEKFIKNIIHNKPFVVDKIVRPQVLIIDEISMLNAQTLDNIEKIIEGVRQNGMPWGGLQIVFVGDFFQLSPVSKYGKETKFAFESGAWERANLTYCYLHEQHRQNDTVFLEILTAIRQGEVTKPQKIALMNGYKGDKKDEMITRLFTHNVDVDRINNEKLAAIDSPAFIFTMETEGNEYLIDMMKKNCLSPEKLVLKKDAVVMFTRNKFKDDETLYVNGTIGTVQSLEGGVLVKTTTGKFINVEREEWSIEEYGRTKAKIVQYPLRLAWAVTIHKSQGMSLDSARIDLSSAFEYGQGYVAISRVRSMEGLLLEGINRQAFEMHPKVIEVDSLFREASDLVV